MTSASRLGASRVRPSRRRVRQRLFAHVETWRPYTLWYVGLVGLGGAALTAGPQHPWRLLAAWAAPTVGWIGGHYVGDYFDRALDAGSKPHRPIPSGRLRPATALACGCACMAVLAVLAVSGGWGTTVVAALGVCAIVGYSRWGKARGLVGNLVRGALGSVALVYGAAVGGHWPSATALVMLVVLGVAFGLHDTMSNLVGTLRDVDGDRAGGYVTLPVSRGTPVAVRTALALYAAMIVAAVVGGVLAGGRPYYFVSLVVVAALGAAALAPLILRRDAMPVTVALRAHAVLVVERVVLASAVVGLGLGVGWQLALVVPLAAFTWWTQSAMRARYELGTISKPPMEDVS